MLKLKHGLAISMLQLLQMLKCSLDMLVVYRCDDLSTYSRPKCITQ